MHASASDTICAYSGADSFKYADFYRRFSVNRFNNSQFLIVHRGNTTVFLSNRYMDEGSFVPVSPPFDNAPWYKPLSDVDNVYDAFLGGVVNGKNNNAVWWAYLYQALMLRDQAVFAGKAILVDHPLLSGHGITAMAVDPNNFRRVCIAGGGPPQDKIYCSLSGSIGKATSAQLANYGKAPVVQWSDVTGNFASLVGSRPKSLAQVVKMIWISKAATTPAPWTNVVVASTGMGLVWMNLAAPGAWTLFPAWLPPVPIVTVKHVASKDMIYVATLGRGVWSLNGISNLAFD